MGSQQNLARGHKVVPVLPFSIHFRYCNIFVNNFVCNVIYSRNNNNITVYIMEFIIQYEIVIILNNTHHNKLILKYN